MMVECEATERLHDPLVKAATALSLVLSADAHKKAVGREPVTNIKVPMCEALHVEQGNWFDGFRWVGLRCPDRNGL